MANRTMHGVMHVGWVPDPDLLVYPPILREHERRWNALTGLTP